MRVVIRNDAETCATWAAQYICDRINAANPTAHKPFVIMLSTGSSVIRTYELLAKHVREGKVSFKHVVTFNTDEFVDLPDSHPQSYHTTMYHTFFQHVDIEPKNVNILNGNASNLAKECRDYESKIKAVGGIDLFLSGCGEDGQVAMNEPGSSIESRTRVKSLSRATILRKATQFGGAEKVPAAGITVGWGTIMEAREILTVVFGLNKANALDHCLERGINHMFPLSFIQDHKAACVVCDLDATAELRTRTVQYFQGIEKVAAMSSRKISVNALPSSL